MSFVKTGNVKLTSGTRKIGVGVVAIVVGLGLTLGGVTAANADPADPGTSDWQVTASQPVSQTGGDGYIPWSIDTTAIDDASYGSNNGMLRGSGLPGSYTVPDTATPAVRDQGGFGDCWSFASSEAAESSLVHNGVFESTSVASQISTSHLVQSVYNSSTFPSTLLINAYNQGGNSEQAAVVWSHWYGAQKASAYPDPTSSTTSNFTVAPAPIAMSNLTSSAYHMRGWWMLPSPRDSSGTYVQSNVDTIKQAIYSYGVISAAFTSAVRSTYLYPAASTTVAPWPAFYDPNDDQVDHAVTIIGWDDNYAVSNFKPGAQPQGPGAFLIQNSWGTSWSHFWISYYDHSLSQLSAFDMVSATPLNSQYGPYDWTVNYSNDELGAMGAWWSNGTGTETFANKFTSSGTSALRAAQVVTLVPGMTVTVSVYLNPTAGSPVTGATQAVVGAAGATSVSMTATYAGYQTVPFVTPVVLSSGQPFSIVVTETAPSGEAPMSVEARYSNSAGAKSPTISADQSYWLLGGWQDLSTFYASNGYAGQYGNVNVIGLAGPVPSYLLNFNAGAGSLGTTGSKMVVFQQPIGTLPTPTLTGSTFDGWFTQATGGSQVSSTTVYTTVGDMTVYAHWTPIGTPPTSPTSSPTQSSSPTPTPTATPSTSHLLSFNAAGGTVSPTSRTLLQGDQYGMLPTPTRAGYTFAGWFNAPAGGTAVTSATTMDASDVTIYAHWTAKSYKVTFNANGGKAPTTASKTVSMAGVYGTLPTTSRTNYDFAGWYTAASGGSKITSTTKFAYVANQTLYAHWTGKVHTVKLKPQSGKVSPKSIKVNYKGKYSKLPTPTRKGHKFLGWYTKASGGSKITKSSTVNGTKNQTLYAHWR